MKKILCVPAAALLLMAAGCGSSNEKSATKTEAQQAEVAAFLETQPIVSGEYTADRYDITGAKAKKGPFDGRIMAAVQQENTGLYVYENGNRTKIKHRILLPKPFEKTAEGLYTAATTDGSVVTINTDSVFYVLTYVSRGDTTSINFNPKPTAEAPALDMMERIAAKIKE